jgi:hypothetical protein
MNTDAARYATLTRDQWAWAFLRRNPEYQSDFRRFIAIWQALETDYGAPPHRDFAKWKLDPRAYGPLDGCAPDALDSATGDLCIGENDRVLIECWMGAKWGFHKFPLDPALDAPPTPDQLSWRPPPAPEPLPADDRYRLDIAFDLSLPLPPQLEAARFRLVSRTAELRRSGCPAPLNVANQRERWTHMLRLLDGETPEDKLSPDDAALLQQARAMVQDGYRDILRLADASKD